MDQLTSRKRELSVLEKNSAQVDITQGYSFLMPAASPEPQELMDVGVDPTKIVLVNNGIDLRKKTNDRIQAGDLSQSWPQCQIKWGDIDDVLLRSNEQISYIHLDYYGKFNADSEKGVVRAIAKAHPDGMHLRITQTPQRYRGLPKYAIDVRSSIGVSATGKHTSIKFPIAFKHLRDVDRYCDDYWFDLYKRYDHSLVMAWLAMLNLAVDLGVCVMPEFVEDYKGYSGRIAMETAWFTIAPSSSTDWIGDALARLIDLLDQPSYEDALAKDAKALSII